MLRKFSLIAKYTGITLFVIFGILLAINWQDEEFLPVSEYDHDHSHIDKPDNAYYAIAGFNSAASENMHVMGYKIVQAYDVFANTKRAQDFDIKQIEKADELQLKGDTEILCKPGRNSACIEVALLNKAALIKLRDDNKYLYERFKALVGYRTFHEDTTYIPSWAGVFSLGYLHMNLIAIEWEEGSKKTAISRLAEITRFFRLLHDKSDYLIHQMIGLTLYQNTLALYSEFMRDCQNCSESRYLIQAIPHLTSEQMCEKRQLYGELSYIKKEFERFSGYEYFNEETSMYEYHDNILYMYFSKPGATFNAVHRKLISFLEVCKLESHQVKKYFKENSPGFMHAFPWYTYIYNPVGKYMLEYKDTGISSFSSYIYRAIDLEAYIRLLKIQSRIYAENIKKTM